MGDTRGRNFHIGDAARGGTTAESSGVRGPGVSDMLRSRRMSLGYELSEIAVALRIRLAYLEAIEQGRFGDLPGAAYANGFLRTYAEHLGLDPQLVLRRFKEETSGGLTAKPELYLPKPAPESRIPGGALLLLAVVLAGSAYGGWYYMNSTGRELVDFVPELPDRLATALNLAPAAPAPGLVVPVTPSEQPPAAASGTSAPPAGNPVPPAVNSAPPAVAAVPPSHSPATPAPSSPAVRQPAGSPPAATASAPDEGDEEENPIVESTPLNDPRSAQAAPQPVPSPASPPPLPAAPGQVAGLPMPPAPPGAPEAGQGDARVYGATSGQSRIQIRATQDSWIQVRDGAGDLLMTRVLRPGDIYRVPDKAGLKMQTGNAGGLQVSVDGGQGTAMGTPGQVMRGVPLDPDRWAGR
ncbi:MAG TPA: RodZ domain-containing protein [Skermanella sp.]|nr:RodZ domain-containing protein [Skermanella sp.]